MRQLRILRALVFSWLALVAPALAGDHALNRATLAGLSGVCVFVSDFKPAAQAAGFDGTLFRTDVEAQLRVGGVRVLNDRELLASPAAPCLYVTVNPLHSAAGESQVFSIALELVQLARLIRGSDAPLALASTWSIHATDVGPLTHVRATLRDMTDTFLSAWRSVNSAE